MASILTPESNAWSLSNSSTKREMRTNRTMSLDRATKAYETERHHSYCSEPVDRALLLKHGVPAPFGNNTSWSMGDVGIKIIPSPAQSGWITRQHNHRSSIPSMPPPPMQPVPLQKQDHHRLQYPQQLHKQQQLHLRQQLQQQQLHQEQVASIDMRGHALPIREAKEEEAMKPGYHHDQPAPRETFQKFPPEPPLPEEICCGSHHRLPVLDEVVSLTPRQDISHPDVSCPVKDRTPHECPNHQQVEEELLLRSGVKNRPAADDTDAADARHAADDAYAAEDTTNDDGAGATVFSRHPDWPSVRKATPIRKGNIISDRHHHSAGDSDSPRKKKVSFRFVLEVYLIPRVTDYSKSETKDIWWSREELMEMKRAGQAQQATLSRMSAEGRVGSGRRRMPRVQRRMMRTLHRSDFSAASPRRLAFALPMYTSSYCGVLPWNIDHEV